MKKVPVLYLDVDGTVREGRDDALGKFVNGPQDVRVFPEAVAMMRNWKKGGGRIVAVSNQGGVALGIVSFNDVMAAMEETRKQAENLFDKIMFCIHHPDAQNPEFARCWCRKPKPGLIIEAATSLGQLHQDEGYPPHMALFVGDRNEDRLCAEAADIDFEDAANWRAQANYIKG